MKTGPYKELEDKFFEGKISPEEEKILRENGVSPFFNALKEEKSEKMDWKFEDFLSTVEETPQVKLHPKIGGGIPKLFWMAASVLLLVGMFFCYKMMNKPTVEDRAKMVENEVVKQKDTFNIETHLAVNQINDTLKVVSDTLSRDSLSTAETNTDSGVLDKILPKRGRLRKTAREKYTYNTPLKNPDTLANQSSSEYQDSYVTVNGHKIENEQEAINVTKYSFQILSEKVAETVASTQVLENLGTDY